MDPVVQTLIMAADMLSGFSRQNKLQMLEVVAPPSSCALSVCSVMPGSRPEENSLARMGPLASKGVC